jgi:hypothetical protein
MQAIVNDLAFTQGVYTSIEEVEEVCVPFRLSTQRVSPPEI